MPELKWLEANQNPYRIRVLDCRPLTQSPHGWKSVTSKPEVAEAFAALRLSDGRQHIGRFPDSAFTYQCDFRYPAIAASDGPVFRAQEMEDKWDFSLYEGRLYISRSWRGHLAVVAGVDFDRSAHVSWVAAPEFGGPLDPPFPLREVDFLIKSHLYRKRVPHPVPAGYSDKPMDIAAYSMNRYGRWASFASFEDTTSVNPWATPSC